MKSIYKITNKLNGKIYIGQSVNPSARWDYHKNRSQEAIGYAIRKYGVENFDFEIIEETEDYNTREMYWIAYYESFGCKGYNMNIGGMGQFKISPKELKEIKHLLQNTKLTVREISEKYNVFAGTISAINNGKSHYSYDNIYPLRKTKEKNLTLEDVKEIENLLLNSGYKNVAQAIQDIDCSRTLIYMINQGKHIYSSNDCKYPIIKGNSLSKEEVGFIEEEIEQTKTSFKKIGKLFSRDEGTISRINKGKHKYSNCNLKFPIR